MNIICSISSGLSCAQIISGSSTVSTNTAIMPLRVNASFSGGYATIANTMSGTFTKNEIGATYSSNAISLPDGNYILSVYFVFSGNNNIFTINCYNGYGGANSYSAVTKSGQYIEGQSYIWGATFTSSQPSSDKKIGFTLSLQNSMYFTEGNITITKITNSSVSGAFAIATCNSSWNGTTQQNYTSYNISNISGLSYNTSSRDFTLPSGTYVITHTASPATIWGMGFQTTSNAATPSSTSNPNNMDQWVYYSSTGYEVGSDTVSWVYYFSSNNKFRFWTNSGNKSGVTAILYIWKVN